MTLPTPQDLNVPILELVRERRALSEGQLLNLLAFATSVAHPKTSDVRPMDVWRFSAIVNMARMRLVRYGLLRVDDDKRLRLTPRGETFLSRGFAKVTARSRQTLDAAVLASLESAYLRSA